MRQKREKYVPKHRQSSAVSVARAAPRKVLRTTVLFSGVAVAATTGAVSSGVVTSPVELEGAPLGMTADAVDTTQAPDPAPDRSQDDPVGRMDAISRSADRAAVPSERGRDRKDSRDRRPEREQDRFEDASPREIGRALLPRYGFAADQFGCLDALYVSESDWDVHADNPTSSAYGIPQALTETHDLPAGYMNDAEVQIRWGLWYIKDSYGTPCSAWEFKQANNYY